MKTAKYNVTAPRTPGAAAVIVGIAYTIAEARKIAGGYHQHGWLTYQDVRINTASGSRKEYAGPIR